MKQERREPYRYPKNVEAVLAEVDHLPVAMLRETIREEVREHPNFVLVGETGSGKTTCLPLLLKEYRDDLGLSGKIAVTQPRRVATRSVSARVADMVGCDVGEGIGYHVRFEDFTSEDTDVTFMTDGLLLRKIQFDKYLRDYCIVMVDEAHERSLNIDLSLGLLKDVNLRRAEIGMDPIHIIVSSATIERNKFAEYIGYGDKKNSVEIPGKMYPVEVFYETYTPPNYDYTMAAAKKVREIIEKDEDGDILIFMPGKPEINMTIENIINQIGDSGVDIFPLHAELSPEDQDKIFKPSDNRKIIVSTNIAETSVTIDGVIHVIDSGLIKQINFDARTGIEQLVLTEHAISGLEQRKGRAGRTAPGKCYRLFTQKSLQRRPLYQTPEMQRSNLSQVVLTMKKVGIEDVERFDFIDPPKREALVHAIETLTLLGALDEDENLTEVGEFMVELGIEPRLGRMLVEAMKPEVNCVNEICIIASFMEGKNLFIRPTDPREERRATSAHGQFKREKDSDFWVILNVWKAYVESGYDPQWAIDNYLNEKVLEEAKNLRLDLIDVLASHKIYIDPNTKPKINKEAISKAITAGLVGNLMRYDGKSFKKVDGTKGDISVHPTSVFYNKGFRQGNLLVSDEIFINPMGNAFACNCLAVKPEWLEEVAPQISREVNRRGGRKSNYNKGRRGGRKNIFDSNKKRK